MERLERELEVVNNIRATMGIKYGRERFEDPILSTVMCALREYEHAIEEKLKQSSPCEAKKDVEIKSSDKLFDDVDAALRGLGRSHSSIEYADFIRQEFENVLQHINVLKIESGSEDLIYDSEWYFSG